MMGFIFALAGLFAGWMVHQAADFLPRFSPNIEKPPARLAAPAVWDAVNARPRPWLGLHVGVELLSAAVFAWLGMRHAGLVYAASYVLLLLVAVIDIKYRLVLNILVYPMMVAAMLINHNLLSLSLGGLFTFSVFFLTAWLMPGSIGGGDVKLAVLFGLFFGFPSVLWALLVGAGSGALAAVFLLTRRKNRRSQIAYAPYLCLGAMVALLFNPFTWII
jgi:prepilin signal peptidase PulO-like enzyme (type II secretory pathway)